MNQAKKRILVLYCHHGPLNKIRHAVWAHITTLDHVAGDNDILYFNAASGAPAWLRRLNFDAVILGTTFLGMRWSHLFYQWKWGLRWLNDLDCPKIALPQDEYDHSETLDEWLYELGVSIIFTVFDASIRPTLYPLMHSRAAFYECLTGYIDDDMAVHDYAKQALPIAARPLDVVYRANHLPYWFGLFGQLKHRIASLVAERAPAFGLTCDISTHPQDTILGPAWLDFIASGRVILGSISGSSALDRRGEIKAAIQAMQRANPNLTFEEASAALPPGWDSYDFDALGPRHLEAVLTRTAQVLVEGRYSGILVPDRHYIPLKRDFSNLDAVLAKIRDHAYLQAMADRAYEEIYRSGSYTYRAFGSAILRALPQAIPPTPAHATNGLRARLGWGLGRAARYRAERQAVLESWVLRLLRRS